MAQPSLRSVPTELPDPPYPADVKSNGFRQEIDLDRILSSKTWALADNECRPWLLMLWTMSWRNVPCGTWEADDEYIAARIGCKLEWFMGHRAQLMRGWVRHSDGLLYHPFIIGQVNDMLSRRGATAGRMKKMRELRAQRVTHSDQSVIGSDASLRVTYAKDQDQDQDQDQGKEKITPKPPRKAKSKPDPIALAPGLRPDVWEDFRSARSKLGAPMTRRAEELAQAKLQTLGGDPNEIVEQSIERGWKGLFPLDQGRTTGRRGAHIELDPATGLSAGAAEWLRRQDDVDTGTNNIIDGSCTHE
jgi:hypothetical protein